MIGEKADVVRHAAGILPRAGFGDGFTDLDGQIFAMDLLTSDPRDGGLPMAEPQFDQLRGGVFNYAEPMARR